MKRPEPLEIYQPMSLQEASRLLKDKGAGGRFLAGGTDLVIAIKEKGLIPKYVVDLKKDPRSFRNSGECRREYHHRRADDDARDRD